MYVQNVSVCTGTMCICVSTCARGAGIHGDVLNVHTGAFFFEWTHGVRREGVVVSLLFSSVNKCVLTSLEHLNPMLGSSLIANFLRRVIT